MKAEPSSAASAVLERAFQEAADLDDEHVSTEHLLLAIMDLEGDPAQALLARHGATRNAILMALTTVRSLREGYDPNFGAAPQALHPTTGAGPAGCANSA